MCAMSDLAEKTYATFEAYSIIKFYGHKNPMTIGLMLPMLAAAHGHQLISDEE